MRACSWKPCRKLQRLGQSHVLRAKPQPHDAAFGAAESSGFRLKLEGMIVIAAEVKVAGAVGTRTLALVMHDEVTFEQNDARIWHWPSSGVDNAALDSATRVDRHIGVPGDQRERDRQRRNYPAALQPSRHPSTLAGARREAADELLLCH